MEWIEVCSGASSLACITFSPSIFKNSLNQLSAMWLSPPILFCYPQGLIAVRSLLDENGNVKEGQQNGSTMDAFVKKVR